MIIRCYFYKYGSEIVVLFTGKDLSWNIDRPILALLKGSAYILTDDAKAEQLHTGKKQNEYNNGGLTGNIYAAEKLLNYHNDQVENRSNAGKAAQNGSKPQRSGGESNDAFNGIIDQLPEAPLGLSVGPFTGGVGNEFCVIAYPGKNTLGKSVILRKVQNTVPDTSAEGAEITGIGLQRYIGNLVDETIEAFLEKLQHRAFISSVLIGSHHIHIRLFLQNFHHVQNNFRALLQIGINKTDIFTGGMLKPCIEAGFFSEISGKGDNLHGAGLGCIELAEIMHGGIFAAVINIYDFEIPGETLKSRKNSLLKGNDIFCFIIAGDNEGKLHKINSQS